MQIWKRVTEHELAKKHGREKFWKSQFSYNYLRKPKILSRNIKFSC